MRNILLISILALFLLIGTNDYLVKEQYWQEYINIDFKVVYSALLTLLLDNLSTERIYLVSIPPVRLSEGFDTRKANRDIDQLNQFIFEKARDVQATYLDINELLKNDRNEIADEYTTDGVHLSELGYQVFLNVIKTYL